MNADSLKVSTFISVLRINSCDVCIVCDVFSQTGVMSCQSNWHEATSSPCTNRSNVCRWKTFHLNTVDMFITHCPTVTLQRHYFDLFRTCRTSSFCTVAWHVARFQLTWRIARSLGDSWVLVVMSVDEKNALATYFCASLSAKRKTRQRGDLTELYVANQCDRLDAMGPGHWSPARTCWGKIEAPGASLTHFR